MSNKAQEELKYDSSAKISSKGTAILGKLTGVCADIINPTRNGRKYSNELWEKVFKDPLVKEQFESGGIFGEMNHPADRDEVDLTQVCVCMPEPPKKNDKGQLIASWDILDTPNGRILKTLCDYGYKLGISSRGSGEVETDYDGNESVDPDSYQLNAWDIVLIPAVKAARLDYVNESLSNKKTLKQALVESLNNASDSDRKIMEDTLNSLDIDLKEDYFKDIKQLVKSATSNYTKNSGELVPQKFDAQYINDLTDELESSGYSIVSSVKDHSKSDKDLSNYVYEFEKIDESVNKAVDNNEAIVEELQNSTKQIKKLQNRLIELQEKLSVCYAKESSQEEEITKLRTVIQRLSEDVKKKDALQNQIRRLNTKLKESNELNDSLKESLEKSTEQVKSGKRDYLSLNESVKIREREVQALKSEITTLNKKIASTSKASSDEINKLNEDYETLKKDSEQIKTQYYKKLDNANKLVEKYKKIADTAVDKYIESEAIKIGVTKEEVKNKLPQSYTFKDIDSICEDLQSYKLSINKLPFRVDGNIKMKATESKHEPILPANRSVDDDVDNSLLEMAGII